MHNDDSRDARLPRGGLYAISDGPHPNLLEACEAALSGGAALLQYRDKGSGPARRQSEAKALYALCARFGVPLIVNDDIQLAAAIGAAGVHLGEDDGDISAARAQLGATAIIGASCYDSIDRARGLAAAGADYLAFGAFYSSPTKPGVRRADIDLLRAAKALGRPLVAIGGITADNAQPLLDAGADFLAVISGLFQTADPAAAARRYAALFKK